MFFQCFCSAYYITPGLRSIRISATSHRHIDNPSRSLYSLSIQHSSPAHRYCMCSCAAACPSKASTSTASSAASWRATCTSPRPSLPVICSLSLSLSLHVYVSVYDGIVWSLCLQCPTSVYLFLLLRTSPFRLPSLSLSISPSVTVLAC
jgi:hypothetical protein